MHNRTKGPTAGETVDPGVSRSAAEGRTPGNISPTDSNSKKGQRHPDDKGRPWVATRFLTSLFAKHTTAGLFITSLANDRAENHRLPSRRIVTRRIPLIERFLTGWDLPGRALYFCVATLKPGIARRAKENLHELVCLHADLDFKNIGNTLAEIEFAVARVTLRPSLVVFSGHGLHLYWILQDALPASRENIGRVESALRKIADVLAGDPAVCECARLMRLPGSHNTKDGGWIDVRIIEQRRASYSLDYIEKWLTTAQPMLQRRPGVKTPYRNNNGGAKHRDNASDPYATLGREQMRSTPIDVDERLAIMRHRGPDETSIHKTQISVTAALLRRGYPIDAAVARVMDATRRAAGRDGARWNWRKEQRDLYAMCRSWLAKHPQVVFEVGE